MYVMISLMSGKYHICYFLYVTEHIHTLTCIHMFTALQKFNVINASELKIYIFYRAIVRWYAKSNNFCEVIILCKRLTTSTECVSEVPTTEPLYVFYHTSFPNSGIL